MRSGKRHKPLFHSLRTRLTVSMMAVALLGIGALGVLTYAHQETFLMNRLDDQLSGQMAGLGRALTDREDDQRTTSNKPEASDDDTPASPARSPIYGLYGELRQDGKPVKVVSFGYPTTTPIIPANIPLNKTTTIHSGGQPYRVRAQRTSNGIIVAAVPLMEVEDNLQNLLLGSLVVVGLMLVALFVLTRYLVTRNLRPLQQITQTAESISSQNLQSRVEVTGLKEIDDVAHPLNVMLDKLEASFAQQEKVDERLRQFLADASHELRTPLVAVRGYAELYRLGGLQPADIPQAFERIETQSARMGRIVEHLLVLARLDAEQSQAQPRPLTTVDVAPVVQGTVNDFRSMYPTRTIHLTMPTTVVLATDPDAISQIVTNLVGNALQHTTEKVEVAVQHDNNELVLTVQDYGPGIPDIRVFERFWRADAGRDRQQGGAGLGLAIAQQLAAAIGGNIQVENTNPGARFTVHIPTTTIS